MGDLLFSLHIFSSSIKELIVHQLPYVLFILLFEFIHFIDERCRIDV